MAEKTWIFMNSTSGKLPELSSSGRDSLIIEGNLSNADAKSFSTFLMTNKTVTSIIFKSNILIELDGWKSITDALYKNHTITNIEIDEANEMILGYNNELTDSMKVKRRAQCVEHPGQIPFNTIDIKYTLSV